jgi:hypothetical protein
MGIFFSGDLGPVRLRHICVDGACRQLFLRPPNPRGSDSCSTVRRFDVGSLCALDSAATFNADRSHAISIDSVRRGQNRELVAAGSTAKRAAQVMMILRS